MDSPPDLRITPKWDNKSPSISVSFEAGIPPISSSLSLEAVLPPGWGWRELEIRGDGLLSWRSSDEDLASEEIELDPDESIKTEMGALDDSELPSKILAPLDADDFSFELNSFSARQPQTPSRRRTVKTDLVRPSAVLKVSPRVPVPAAMFELDFEPFVMDFEEEEDSGRVLILEGTLVPLPLALVSPDVPVPIPFVRFDEPELPTQCSVVCPAATFSAEIPEDVSPQLCSTSSSSLGTFTWTDDAGIAVPRRTTLPVSGPVRVAVQRNIWGVQTCLTALNWPQRTAEVAFTFPVPSVRVIKATSQGTQLPHTVLPHGGGVEVRVEGGKGNLEIVLEVADDVGVALPSFPSANGELMVELAGDGWDSESHSVLRTDGRTALSQT